MANVKITDLTAYTDPLNTDVLAIVDVTNNVTKKVSIANMAKNVSLGTAALPGVAFDGDPNTGISSPGADQLAISTNGTGRLFVDASGKIGINTAPPAGNEGLYLLVSSPTADTAGLQVKNGANATLELLLTGATYNYANIGANETWLRSSKAGAGANLNIGCDEAAAVKFITNALERARIRSDGTFEIKGAGTAGTSPGFSVNPSTPANSFVIDSSGRLGIGTSSPTCKLDLFGGFYRGINGASTTYLGDGASLVSGASVSSTALRFDGDSLLFAANSTRLMTLTSAGNVGIGTTSPQAKLHVNTGTNENLYVGSLGGSGAGVYLATANDAGSLNVPLQIGSASDIRLAISGTEAARIDSSRRLLVGTSSTVSAAGADAIQQIHSNNYMQLALINNVNAAGGCGLALGHSRGASAGTFNLLNDGDEFGAIYFVGADGTDLTTQGATIRAEVDGTPGANDMPGRLVFSTTADGASSPTERMRITSDGGIGAFMTDTGAYFRTSAATTATVNALVVAAAATNTTNGTNTFVVEARGNVYNQNNSYGSLSDLKLKENIVDANSQWDDLKALQVRNYNFKEGQTHTQIGLVAQEVELVSPGLVSESPDRDEDGNDLGTVTKSVNYSVLYMKAVKALQEAMERIEALEADVAQLKGV